MISPDINNYLSDSPINFMNNNNNSQQKLNQLLSELNELITSNSSAITIDKQTRELMLGLLLKNSTNDYNSGDKSLINTVCV